MSILRSSAAIVRASRTLITRPRARSVAAILAAFFCSALGANAALAAARPHAPSLREPAHRHSVKLAEVASRVDASAISLRNLTELLKADAEAELAAIDWSRVGVKRSYLVSASVLKLVARREGGRLHAACTVSATIRDAERGTILAVVEGRARAELPAPRPKADASTGEAERGALSGAVHGAVSAIPEAIRRASD